MASLVNKALLALFGGTFDPPHNAHIEVARAAFSSETQLQANALRIVPVGSPYQRGRAAYANADDRVAMLNLAFKDWPNVTIDSRELTRQGPTYTVDTLTELRAELGKTLPMAWLIGSDAFAKLDTWHRWRELFDLAHFAVISRPGFTFSNISIALDTEIASRQCPADQLENSPCGKWALLNLAPAAISSTEIRRHVAAGESVRGFVPDAICDYIAKHHLYHSQEASAQDG
jgi:nicotinate-nucleotide adenylyltransferase